MDLTKFINSEDLKQLITHISQEHWKDLSKKEIRNRLNDFNFSFHKSRYNFNKISFLGIDFTHNAILAGSLYENGWRTEFVDESNIIKPECLSDEQWDTLANHVHQKHWPHYSLEITKALLSTYQLHPMRPRSSYYVGEPFWNSHIMFYAHWRRKKPRLPKTWWVRFYT